MNNIPKDCFSDDEQNLNDDIWDQPWSFTEDILTPWEDAEDEELDSILEEVLKEDE